MSLDDDCEQHEDGFYYLPGTCDPDPNDERNYVTDPDHSGNDRDYSLDVDGNYHWFC